MSDPKIGTLADARRCFKPQVQKNSDGCWIWPACITGGFPNGMVSLEILPKKTCVNVRRWLWQRKFHELSRRFCVEPTCGNQRCVNPKHVRIVLSGQLDRKSQPRRPAPKHGQEWATVVTKEMGDQIVALQKTGKFQREIAEVVGCHQSTVSRFLRGQK